MLIFHKTFFLILHFDAYSNFILSQKSVRISAEIHNFHSECVHGLFLGYDIISLKENGKRCFHSSCRNHLSQFPGSSVIINSWNKITGELSRWYLISCLHLILFVLIPNFSVLDLLMSYEERLRTLRLSSLEKRRLRGWPHCSLQLPEEGSGDRDVSLFSLVINDRTCGNGTKLPSKNMMTFDGIVEKELSFLHNENRTKISEF